MDQTEPWHLYDPNTTLHHIVTRVKGFTTDMATHNTTPFLHRYLYRDCAPQCIMSCFATSVLYANRTPANTAMVMRAIHTTVRQKKSDKNGRKKKTPKEKQKKKKKKIIFFFFL